MKKNARNLMWQVRIWGNMQEIVTYYLAEKWKVHISDNIFFKTSCMVMKLCRKWKYDKPVNFMYIKWLNVHQKGFYYAKWRQKLRTKPRSATQPPFLRRMYFTQNTFHSAPRMKTKQKQKGLGFVYNKIIKVTYQMQYQINKI